MYGDINGEYLNPLTHPLSKKAVLFTLDKCYVNSLHSGFISVLITLGASCKIYRSNYIWKKIGICTY